MDNCATPLGLFLEARVKLFRMLRGGILDIRDAPDKATLIDFGEHAVAPGSVLDCELVQSASEEAVVQGSLDVTLIRIAHGRPPISIM